MPIDDVRVDAESSGGGTASIELTHRADARRLDELEGHWAQLPGEARAFEFAQRRELAVLRLNAFGKRAVDIAISATVLLLTVPFVALVAVLIVLDSPGPVFYRAARVGRNGQPLRMLKFRKMRNGAMGTPLTMAEDERFTRIGRLLAKAKLDELPQLWHVLRGEMSLIGPRPEDPGFVAERADEYEEILRVRPGVTGLSQIAFAEESAILCKVDPMNHYRSRIFPQKVRLDRMYAANPTLATDLRILFWTCAAVILRRDVAVHRETGRMNLRRR
jgi:lipopolysaccharide/colanic/teichoic acid biosynthesis glycosyltransferase